MDDNKNIDTKNVVKIKNKKENKWKRLKTYQKVLIIFFSTVIFLGAVAAGIFYYYIGTANKTINSGTTTEVKKVLTPVETLTAPVTILLLGRDTRDAETDRGRADTIMLLHINPSEKRAVILSIPRDTLVEIPGYGEDKINAAYALGGEELMIKTVSDFLDCVINHYITIDFDGFVKLIDELGGVDVAIDRPIEDPKTGAYISAGNHHFTGEQALAYTRSRSTELGDIGRIQRQQYVLKELVRQKLNFSNVSNINDYFNIIVENTRTDLDLMTIVSYARAALDFGTDNISSAIIPTYHELIEDGTKSVQIPDKDEARAMWERVILGQAVSKYGVEYIGGSENIPDSFGTEQTVDCMITVKNTSTTKWTRGGVDPFYLSYHWLDFNSKKAIVFDGKRSLLPYDTVLPGDTVNIDLEIVSPPDPGDYILQIDMVHEGKTWFSYQGVPPLEKYVSVGKSYAAAYDDGGTTPNKVDAGEVFTTKVKVTNNSFLDWINSGSKRVDLGVHWYNRDTREVLIFDADSGELPNNVRQGESAEVEMIITAPQQSGRYVLAYDLVQETVTWFSQQEVIPLEVDIDVGIVLDNAIIKKTSVTVYNGCGISGAATEAQQYLKNYNFKQVNIANAKEFGFKETIMIYKSDKLENAEQAILLFDGITMEQYSSKWKDYYSGADVIIILGSDYKDLIK